MKIKHLNIPALLITAFALSACVGESSYLNTAPQSSNDAAAHSVTYAKMTVSTDTRTIVFLGDSLTAGFGLSRKDALPQQVAAQLQDSYPNLTIINSGRSGDTTAGGFARYEKSVAAHNPDILILALGANDYIYGRDAKSAKANLTAIIDKAQNDGIQVALAGLVPQSMAKLQTREGRFAAIYPDLARQYNLPLHAELTRGVTGNRDLLLWDQLHPNARGVTVMASNMADFLKTAVLIK
ncbi:arylesterase [Hellea sp.]|nr:arylesterase [Hellea sp.]